MIHIDHKYIRLLSSQLANFKQKTEGLYNFRCPICGDSEKNKFKARGYVYARKGALFFKCHNCGDGRSLGNLIKHIDPAMYSQYVMERYASGAQGKTPHKEPDFKFEAPQFKKRQLEDVGAVQVKNLQSDHPANQFIEARKLPLASARELYYIDDEEKLEGISDKYKDRIAGHSPRILIPFYDRKGNLTGLTGRALDDKGLRYLALKFNAEDEPLIFGLEKWNGRIHTIVVEGAFDAHFINNAIAVGGSDFNRIVGLVEKDNATIVFDNEPRNKEIVKRMEKIIKDGWTICIWPEKILEKDVNDMVIAGRKPEEIEEVINRNKFYGLQAQFKLNGWKKC